MLKILATSFRDWLIFIYRGYLRELWQDSEFPCGVRLMLLSLKTVATIKVSIVLVTNIQQIPTFGYLFFENIFAHPVTLCLSMR